ncbi:hypothetical protein QRD89_06120 [Halobacillus sp. ACCC02827]|uniref:hypothetical protein n=1 Tax=Bacillaceae TaxID=186817 RepID=UPI0002A50BDE|nr:MULTISPECIES: hypothetical protein [Bacillaceae]ELK46542.1 hypothetical protein D479_10426 [Halobacillus sp. BAB-2008]QHT46106.1 hypothetical protein M662_06245 [Bacillus sp. SB49]WJE16920.1 hypothetical protein QRD89_06120 [Halobacillus sp. ACCC02827]
MERKRIYYISSLVCFLICIIVWIPNLFFRSDSPLWMATFLFGPIGILFAAFIEKYWLMIVNTVMLFSFFLLMAVNYYLNYITIGHP